MVCGDYRRYGKGVREVEVNVLLKSQRSLGKQGVKIQVLKMFLGEKKLKLFL